MVRCLVHSLVGVKQDIGFLALCLASVFLLLSLGPSQFFTGEISGLVFLLSLFVARVVYPTIWRDTRFAWGVIGLVGVVSACLSVVPRHSIQGFYDFLRSSWVFFGIASVLCVSSSQLIKKALLISLIGVIIFISIFYGYVTYSWGQSFSLRDNPVLESQISGIHEFANIAAVSLLVSFVMFIHLKRTMITNVFSMLVFTVLVYILLMSDSRGAYLALVFCMLYMLSWYKKPLITIYWLAAASLIFGFTWVCFFTADTIVLGKQLPDSFIERIELAKGTWQAFLGSPLYGYGFNSFKYVSSSLGVPYHYTMPHNIFLEVLFSAGIIGSIILILAMIKIGLHRQSIQNLSKDRLMLYRIGVIIIVYTIFRGFTELHLDFNVFSALFGGLALIYASRFDRSNLECGES